MKIGIVDEGLPYPLVSGKPIRSFNLISRLAKSHDITYYAPINAPAADVAAAVKKLVDVGVKPVLVDHEIPQDRGIRFGVRLARNLFSSVPYSVQRHMSPAMISVIKRDLAKYDLWHCEWTPYAELFRHLDVARLVVDAHNIESRIWQRNFELESLRHRKWYIKKQWKKFQTFERWAFSRATQTIVVSQIDAATANREFDAHHVSVVENGVDTDYFQPGRLRRSPHQLLILGSLFWRPNLDGIRLFLDSVFPRVLQLEPSTRLRIVGRTAPRWLIEYAEKHSQIEVHANVPDVRSYLSEAGMLIVPLRVGGGSRLKILEAAAAGVPIVSTRVGAEGLNLVDGEHFVMAEAIEDLGGLIVRCIRDYPQSERLAIAARRLVVDQYDWELLANKLDKVWRGHE